MELFDDELRHYCYYCYYYYLDPANIIRVILPKIANSYTDAMVYLTKRQALWNKIKI